MRQLFLYGGYADNFAVTTNPFVTAAGGAEARIAVLFVSPESVEKFGGWYRDQWLGMGAAEVIPVCPAHGTLVLDQAALHTLRTCSGIFMCGGDTRKYRDIYVRSQACEIIRERYQSGVPYAGVSAGALLAPDRCSIWGDRLTTAENRLTLRGSEDGCDAELETGEGLGLLPGCITEAHFTEQSGFTRLAVAMERESMAEGLGFDDPICVHIQNESLITVTGRGTACRLVRNSDGHLTVQRLEPGQSVAIGNPRRGAQ